MRTLPRLITAGITTVGVLAGAVVADAHTPPRLRLDGIGPLTLGMRQSTALTTGWLANRTLGGCVTSPTRPVVYTFTGTKAPAGISGSASFVNGRLERMSFTKGVQTRLGIRPGVSTLAAMRRVYRRNGFSVASFSGLAGTDTIVTATRGGRELNGYGTGSVVKRLSIPFPPEGCD